MDLIPQSRQANPPGYKSKEKSDVISGEHNSGTATYIVYSTSNLITNNVVATYKLSTSWGHISDTESSKNELYEIREKELENLVGKKKFHLLDRESRMLLINIVGVIDYGISIDIEKTLKYSIYNEKS